MTRYSWMIWYAAALHTMWGMLLLFSSNPMDATPVNAIAAYFPSRLLVSALLLSASVLAVAALTVVNPRRSSHVLMLLPQQMLLLLSAFGGLSAALVGHYADFTQRPPLFILADQFPSICAAVFHTFAILDIPFGQWIEKVRAGGRLRE